MKFTSNILALALAAATTTLAAPVPKPLDLNPTDNVDVHTGTNGRVDWKSSDGQNRVVYCTPSIGHEAINPIELPAGQTVTSYFPVKWIGNCWGVIEGQENTGTGMLAEFNFNDWEDMTYFDVSAIVVPSDTNNVCVIMPAVGDTPMSGCFSGVGDGQCTDNTYVLPDDVQTKVTAQNHLEVYLGCTGASSTVTKRTTDTQGESVARQNVLETSSKSE